MTYIEKQYAIDTGFRMINTNLVNFEDTFFLPQIKKEIEQRCVQ